MDSIDETLSSNALDYYDLLLAEEVDASVRGEPDESRIPSADVAADVRFLVELTRPLRELSRSFERFASDGTDFRSEDDSYGYGSSTAWRDQANA